MDITSTSISISLDSPDCDGWRNYTNLTYCLISNDSRLESMQSGPIHDLDWTFTDVTAGNYDLVVCIINDCGETSNTTFGPFTFGMLIKQKKLANIISVVQYNLLYHCHFTTCL